MHVVGACLRVATATAHTVVCVMSQHNPTSLLLSISHRLLNCSQQCILANIYFSQQFVLVNIYVSQHLFLQAFMFANINFCNYFAFLLCIYSAIIVCVYFAIILYIYVAFILHLFCIYLQLVRNYFAISLFLFARMNSALVAFPRFKFPF